jgi:hypothetical protein
MTPGELWWIDAQGVEYGLNETDLGLIVGDGPLGLDAPPVEVTTTPRAGAGSILTGNRYAARPVTIPVFFNGTTHRQALADFVDSLSLGAGQLKYINLDGRARRLRDVIYDGGFEGDESQARSDWSRRVLNLVALDPLWYDDPQDFALGPPEGDQTYDAALPYDEEAPYDGAASGINGGGAYDEALPYDEDAPYDGGAVVQFDELTSTAGVWPTITVHGPATYVQVLNMDTGEIIETLPTTVIPDGGDLIVITRPEDRAILLSGAEAWDKVTAETSASFQLFPGQLSDVRDENGVQVRDSLGRIVVAQGLPTRLAFIVQGTSASSYVRVAYEERWLYP